uniref:Uncharacterized protein n=1 Tax=viral metagenome TaxID=1070528 RepID=A0A6C0ELR7_9ZZZZ
MERINICYTCGLESWNGKPIALRQVHLSDDSYILQCPNCLSHMRFTNIVFLNTCVECGCTIPNGRRKCCACIRPYNKRALQKELIAMDFDGVQRKYCVDRDTIIAWINN